MNVQSAKKFLLFLFLSTALIRCSEQDKVAIEQAASVFDIEQGKASIKRSNLRFMQAFAESDSVELANCFTKNAVLMIDGFPSVKGRDEITSFYSNIMKNGIKDYELTTKNVWGDSSILVEEGVYRLTDASDKEMGKGKYIVLWQQESGNWKMFRDIWARDFPSDALLPRKDSTATKPSKKLGALLRSAF